MDYYALMGVMALDRFVIDIIETLENDEISVESSHGVSHDDVPLLRYVYTT